MSVLHPDFEALPVQPGESHITDSPELFELVNLIAFGGAADRPSHVPAEVGAIGPVVLWESTGANDSLPFWNTNYQCDVYLYLVHGSVRMEFKEPEGTRTYGHYLGRTGDLLRLPKGIAHRTFSGDGKRRISLEMLERNPAWSTIGEVDVPADASGAAGVFRFALEEEAVVISWPSGSLQTPRHLFIRGLRALVAYELHLDHNEFEGGFVVHDLGERVALRAHGFEEVLERHAVLGVLKGLVDADRLAG